MGRSATGLAAVWIVSVAPVALPEIWSPLGPALGGASRAALAALPWIAWLGAPRRPGVPEVRTTAASWVETALAAPPLAAGVGVDVVRGGGLAASAATAIVSLAMIALLARASEAAAVTSRGARVHGLVWLAAVPGAPLLKVVLELGGAPALGRAPSWLGAIAGASPIAWAWRAGVDGERASPAVGDAAGAIGLCLVLLALSFFAGGDGPARRTVSGTGPP